MKVEEIIEKDKVREVREDFYNGDHGKDGPE